MRLQTISNVMSVCPSVINLSKWKQLFCDGQVYMKILISFPRYAEKIQQLLKYEKLTGTLNEEYVHLYLYRA